jgi:hypothetical protein
MENIFLSSQNVRLLWDLLSEDPSISNLPQSNQESVYNMFIQNIKYFYKNVTETSGTESKQDNLQLVSLNKRFLTMMLKMMKNETKQATTEPTKKYKIEDIQSERQKTFESQLNQRKQEFEQYNTPKKPPVPNFADNLDNEKIKNIDELISQTISQRNFDIQPLKYIQIQEPVPNNFNKEIIELSPVTPVTPVTNEISILQKLKTINEPVLNEDFNLKTKLETLEEKIDKIYNIIQNIYNKLNTEMV